MASPPSPPPSSPPAPPARGSPELAEGVRLLGNALSFASFVSTYVAGWCAVAIAILLGPSLAMFWCMLQGNTEPTTPTAEYPMWLTVVAAVLPVPLAYRREFRYALLASVPLLLVPGWYVHTLAELANRP